MRSSNGTVALTKIKSPTAESVVAKTWPTLSNTPTEANTNAAPVVG